MPCGVCHGPIVYDPENGERFCAEDPSHGADDEGGDDA